MTRRKEDLIQDGLSDYFEQNPTPEMQRAEWKALVERRREELLGDFSEEEREKITGQVQGLLNHIQHEEGSNTFRFTGEETVVIDPQAWHSDWRDDPACLQQRAVEFMLELELGFDPHEYYVDYEDRTSGGGFILRPDTTYSFREQ